MTRLLAIAFLVAAASSQAADRFTVIPLEKLSPEQDKLIQNMLAGPRGGGDAGPEQVKRIREHGLFSGYLQSPDLGDRLQKFGEYVRFNTSINPRLNEFAILITARYWAAQYEWYAHLPLALKAGLDPKIAEELAANKRPSGMKEDEATVYDFCTQVHRAKKVSDPTFKRAVELFGEKGVMDLIGVIGYYTVASMVLNVNEAPVPAGQKKPLAESAADSNLATRMTLDAYRRDAEAGNGEAAKRLGDLYAKGSEGIPKDYAASLRWYKKAKDLGVKVQ